MNANGRGESCPSRADEKNETGGGEGDFVRPWHAGVGLRHRKDPQKGKKECVGSTSNICYEDGPNAHLK